MSSNYTVVDGYDSMLDKGCAHKHIVRDDNGDMWLYKDSNQGEGEVRAYAYAVVFGVNVPEVIETYDLSLCGYCHSRGSVMRFLDGAIEGVNVDWTQYDDAQLRVMALDMLRIHVFDGMIGNWDRHHYNWMVKDGRVWAIDNGLNDKYEKFVNGFCFRDDSYSRNTWPYELTSHLRPSDIIALVAELSDSLNGYRMVYGDEFDAWLRRVARDTLKGLRRVNASGHATFPDYWLDNMRFVDLEVLDTSVIKSEYHRP